MIHQQADSTRRKEVMRRATEAVHRSLALLPSRELEEFVGKVEQMTSTTESPATGLARALGGREYSEEERVLLEHLTLLQRFQRRRELLKDSLTVAQVAELLGTSRQTPHDRVKSGSLLAIEDRGMLRFPAWQFDPESENGVVAGLPRVARLLRVSPLAKISWFTKPNPFLDGKTPLAALKDGRTEEVAGLARAVGWR